MKCEEKARSKLSNIWKYYEVAPQLLTKQVAISAEFMAWNLSK